MASNPSYLPPNALLTDLRWRDYTVTLLQTSPPDVISPLLAEAGHFLQDLARNNRGTSIMPEYGSGIHYFEWKDSSAARLLGLLQEGLSRRLEIVPETLRESVKKYLDARWNEGDSYDRVMVISLGGLLPEGDLEEKIGWAVQSGTIHHWDAAVTSSFFLTNMPEEMASWFRVQLANRLLFARQRADVLKLEAIAARSPVNIGAAWIVSRARDIRGLFRFFGRASSKLVTLRLRELSQLNQGPDIDMSTSVAMQIYLMLLPLMLIIYGVKWGRLRK